MVQIGAEFQFMVPSHRRRRRIATGNSRRQIERFGKFSHTALPGLSFAIPIIDEIAYKRSLKETTIDIHPQTAITKDNVHVHLDGAVYTRVVDAYKASYATACTQLAPLRHRRDVSLVDAPQVRHRRSGRCDNYAGSICDAQRGRKFRARSALFGA